MGSDFAALRTSGPCSPGFLLPHEAGKREVDRVDATMVVDWTCVSYADIMRQNPSRTSYVPGILPTNTLKSCLQFLLPEVKSG